MAIRTPAQRRAMFAKKRTMFGPARHPSLAALITIRSPDATRDSVVQIRRAVREGRISKEVARKGMVLAGNRASAQLNRVKAPLSPREQREMKEVASIYHREARRL